MGYSTPSAPHHEAVQSAGYVDDDGGVDYGEDADDNPWDGWSLEWATSSPPPHNSFVEIPTLKIAEEEHK